MFSYAFTDAMKCILLDLRMINISERKIGLYEISQHLSVIVSDCICFRRLLGQSVRGRRRYRSRLSFSRLDVGCDGG